MSWFSFLKGENAKIQHVESRALGDLVLAVSCAMRMATVELVVVVNVLGSKGKSLATVESCLVLRALLCLI